MREKKTVFKRNKVLLFLETVGLILYLEVFKEIKNVYNHIFSAKYDRTI